MEVVTPVLEQYDNLAYLVKTLNYIKVNIIIYTFDFCKFTKGSPC